MNLNVVFDLYNKTNMELRVCEEIHDQLIYEKETVEMLIKNNLYENWMKKIGVIIADKDGSTSFIRVYDDTVRIDEDKDLKLVISNIFTNNQNKPPKFFNNIINTFCEDTSYKETILGRRDMFKLYLVELQRKSYEQDWITDEIKCANMPLIQKVSDEIVERSLEDLIGELDDDADDVETNSSDDTTSSCSRIEK